MSAARKSSGVFRMTPETRATHTHRFTQTGARMSDEDLRSFEHPRTWREILETEPHRPEAWWRSALIEADEGGRKLVEWDIATKTWRLSDKGRERLRIGEAR